MEAQVAALDDLSSSALRERWSALTGTAVPRISPKLLRLALNWELQARSLGGLSRATIRTLDQLGRGETRTTPARPGMRLVREWQGRVHVVTIGEGHATGAGQWGRGDARRKCLAGPARAQGPALVEHA